jgi:hypothetical protein
VAKKAFEDTSVCFCGHVGAAHQAEGNMFHKCKATVIMGFYTYPCNCSGFYLGEEIYE